MSEYGVTFSGSNGSTGVRDQDGRRVKLDTAIQHFVSFMEGQGHGTSDLGSEHMHPSVTHDPDDGCGEVVDEGAVEEMLEVRVLDYSFYPTVTLGGSQIIRGVCRPMFGRCARRVTARVISNENMSWFVKREGHVWHILHNRPHPGFPQMRAAIDGEANGACSSFLVMDDMDVDLLSYVRERGSLSEQEARPLFRQILSAVIHANRNRIVLRDLRLDRVFFTDETHTTVVIADIEGAEVMARPGSSELDVPVHERLHLDDGCCDDVLDVTALGEILRTMLTGTTHAPLGVFAPMQSMCLYQKHSTHTYADETEISSHVSQAAQELIRSLREWDSHCSTQIMEDLLEDPWLLNTDGVSMSLPMRDDVAECAPPFCDGPMRFRRRGSLTTEIDNDHVVPGSSSSSEASVDKPRQARLTSSHSEGRLYKVGTHVPRRRLRRKSSTDSLGSPPSTVPVSGAAMMDRRRVYVRPLHHHARRRYTWHGAF